MLELALQFSDEISSLGAHKDLSVVAVYGGASMGEQLDRLKKGAEIVVGTPGRIYDHIRRGTLDSYPKPRNLLYMIGMEEPESGIVFCNTRNDTGLVTAVLNRHGYDAELLNGELPQKERERVMTKAKRGEVRFMVATDIAARGIDISDLSHVINYSLPEDPAVYLHRVGRTGRIGKKGTAISLVSGAEIVTLSALEKRFGIQFETRKLPTPEEAKSLWT